ncbi:hypothetical protein NUU61_004183 [Penicillium alfredii]|uniref:ubiquitinyl hydrolase 1 n=1 Tax=Penicillium alfredii TaxID=1506179 RepID=A0A9W9FKM9_9EURO|nr:uncharacterized protein NUU61_004183 [Penicillium alfredii]KAJ5101961.1 hypothetical protein NUU61_004183 [Penicillium alfredii]
MNARREGADTFSSRPVHYASRNTQYETARAALQNNQALAYTFAVIVAGYLVLDYLGFAPISLIQTLWNGLVYFTPARIVVALDSRMSTSDSSPSDPSPMSFQSKSEAMQRIFGLDNNTFPFISRSRSLSGLGNALLGNSADATPPGLGNWDNSCYQNSIIQGLASLKSLSAFLDRNVEVLAEKGSFSTHQALRGIIEHLNSSSNYGHKLWIPPDLKSMSSWQQQDAQEYFAKVVDQIDLEILQASRGQTKNMGLKMTGPEENIFSDSHGEGTTVEDPWSTLAIEKASLRNPLEGLLAQRVGCMKCGWTEGLSLIPFNCLTVPLGGDFEYDIRNCLDQYMTLEPIEGVECAKCTLLRAQEQLHSLLGGIEEDENQPVSSESPNMSSALRTSAQSRLEAVQAALEENDFAEKTLANQCHIPSKNRVSTTKSRQAVVARTPQCLAIHVNRSLFDEMTGMLRKNYAAVHFPKTMDLSNWCLGIHAGGTPGDTLERWETNPSESMLPRPGDAMHVPSRRYELRAIITHYGRHENGHYICYRRYPTTEFPAPVPVEIQQAEGDKEKSERWYRLSDEDVQMVSEAHVMSQGGVFMLFYEAIEDVLPAHPQRSARPDSVPSESAESVSNFTMPEGMSTASTVTDAESSTSRATSVSAPDHVSLPDVKPAAPSLKTSNAVNINSTSSTDEINSPSLITA